jgi:hypothetical protein
MKPLLPALLLSVLSPLGLSAQTVTLLEFSTVSVSTQLVGAVGGPLLAVGQSVTLSRPYSDTTALLPTGLPTFYGGYTISYANNTSGPLHSNTLDLAGSNGVLLGAYTGFTGPTGSFTTEIEGFFYVPVVGVASNVVPFATFRPTQFAGGIPSGVAGELRMAARVGTNWFVSDTQMLSYTFLPTLTTVSSELNNLWRPFDPVTLSYGSGQQLPLGSLTAIGVYFDHVGTLTKNGTGDFVSEIKLERIGYVQAVPEPATYGLFGAGFTVLSLFWRRFRLRNDKR